MVFQIKRILPFRKINIIVHNLYRIRQTTIHDVALHLLFAAQKVLCIILTVFCYTVDLVSESVHFFLYSLSVRCGKCSVRSLNSKFVHTLEHIMNFRKGPVCCLDNVYRITCIVFCFIKAPDLCIHPVGYCHSRR